MHIRFHSPLERFLLSVRRKSSDVSSRKPVIMLVELPKLTERIRKPTDPCFFPRSSIISLVPRQFSHLIVTHRERERERKKREKKREREKRRRYGVWHRPLVPGPRVAGTSGARRRPPHCHYVTRGCHLVFQASVFLTARIEGLMIVITQRPLRRRTFLNRYARACTICFENTVDWSRTWTGAWTKLVIKEYIPSFDSHCTGR